jgi:AraC family L-rhamnose operon transcriptional activator RhaR/AraC family L-rhamnose operon regulatory protein RhaS
MINIDYHSTLISFVAFDKLPLWVTSPALPQHPERKFHDHEYSEIVVILKGDAVHLTEKAAVPIKAGDVLVIYPGQIHAYDKTEGMKLVNIIYDHRRLPVPLLDAYSLPLFKYFFPDKKNYKDQMQLEAVTRLKEKDLKHVAELIEALGKRNKDSQAG